MKFTRRRFLCGSSAGALSWLLYDPGMRGGRARGAPEQPPDSQPLGKSSRRHQPAGACERAGMDPAGVDKIAAHFATVIDGGSFHGAQLAIYRNGELVMELAGGKSGANQAVAFTSLLCILSTTKALTALVMHTLHERGVFQYEDRVAKHWPDFAHKGKGEITIAQVLSHRAGLVMEGFSGYLQWREWSRPGGVAHLIENMEPKWKPGTANGYHGQAFGQVCDELIQRWTRKNTGEWLRAEICGPLGIDDVYIGLPDAAWPRFAPFVGKPGQRQSPLWKPPPGGESHFFNSREILRQCLAWGSGVARARDLARLMNVYAFEGSYGGKTFFSKQAFNKIVTPTNQPDDVDRVLRKKARWGLGVLVGLTEGTPQAPGHLFGKEAGPRTCGHLGGNSSLSWADPDLRLAVSFISTGAAGEAHYQPLSDLIRAACKR